MANNIVDRTTLTAAVDDDGSNTTGTVETKAWLASVMYDPVEAVISALFSVCQGRLTLQSGTAIATTDQTAKTTVYFTPYKGARIGLYTGTQWVMDTFAEISLALGTLVNAQGYDVFAYDSAGTVTLEALEWANATVTMTIAAPGVVTWTAHGMATGNSITFTTSGALPTGVTANTQYWITVVDANSFKLSTSPANVSAGTFITTSGTQSGTHTGHQPQARQTALTTQDGIYVKTGATTRRYLGSFLTTATTTTEDSAAKRYLWNYYNRAPRSLLVKDTTASWTYVNPNGVWRQARASAANQAAVFIGVSEVEIDLRIQGLYDCAASGPQAGVSIGEDSTNTPATEALSSFCQGPSTNDLLLPITCSLRKMPTVGYHAYPLLEVGVGAAATYTFYGYNAAAIYEKCGMNGSILG